MKFLKLLILILISANSFAQYTPIRSWQIFDNAGAKNFFIASDTTVVPDASKSYIAIKNAVMYYWNGTAWTAISGTGGGGGGTYTLPQATPAVRGGITYNTDFYIDANGRLGIDTSKKNLWNTVVLKANQTALRDTAIALRAAIPNITIKQIGYDSADFDTTGNVLKAVSHGELEPAYKSSIWYVTDPTSVPYWNNKADQAALNDTAAALRSLYKKDTTYFDHAYFDRPGTVDSPIISKLKTINGVALNGTGNISISGGSGGAVSSLTTNFNTGVATLTSGTLNVPNYTMDTTGLGIRVTNNTAAIATKEPAIAAGTTSDYWRGDKTWQTFPTIPTNTNQLTNGAGYITGNQAITVTATGDATGTSTSSATSPSLPLTLANTTVAPGSYTNTSLTVDAKGRITAASNGSAGGTGTVTSVATNNATGLTGGTITGTGTLAIDTTVIRTVAMAAKLRDSLGAIIGTKANSSNTISINGTSQTLGSNPSFTVSGGGGGTASGEVYVNANTGNDANTGLTQDISKATLSSAVSSSTSGQVFRLLGGSVFREKVLLQNISKRNFTFEGYNFGMPGKDRMPIVTSNDIVNAGWQLLSGTNNTYYQLFQNNANNPTGVNYNYINPVQVDTALEKTAFFTAYKSLDLASSLAAVETTPGSFWNGASNNGEMDTVYIRLSSGTPGSSPYRIEVPKRTTTFYGQNQTTTNNFTSLSLKNLILRGAQNGYGVAGGDSTYLERIIFQNYPIHAAVLYNSSINKVLALPTGKNIENAVFAFYRTNGNGGTYSLRNSVGVDIRQFVIAHNSGGINHARINLINNWGWADPDNALSFYATSSTDTVNINYNYINTRSSVFNGDPKVLYVNNSVIDSIYYASFIGNTGLNKVWNVNNSLFRTFPGGSLYTGTTPNTFIVSNSTLHLKGTLLSAPTVRYSIIACENSGQTQIVDSKTVNYDYNVYVKIAGSSTLNFTASGQQTDFATWQSGGQDVHSKFITVNNLREVFVSPETGNYTLIQGGWGDTIRAVGAGMSNPVKYLPAKPTYEIAAEWIREDKIPLVSDMFSTRSGTGIQNITTLGNTVNAANGIAVFNSSGQYPAGDGSLITGVTASGAWKTAGNAAAQTDFLGTTNNVSTKFIANNQQKMRLDSAAGATLNIQATGSGSYINAVASNGGQPYLQLVQSGGTDARLYNTAGLGIGNITTGSGFSVFTSGNTAYGGLTGSVLTATTSMAVTNIAGAAQLMLSAAGGNNQQIAFRENGASNRGVIGYAGSSGNFQIRTNAATTMSNGTLAAIFDANGSQGLGGITSVSQQASLEVGGTAKGVLLPRVTTAQRDAIKGVISVTVSGTTTGYTNGAALIFTGGGGSGAAGTIATAGGVISNITISSPGNGYSTAPTVTTASGTGATFTATLNTPEGLEVYNLDTHTKQYYNGTVWKNILTD